MRQNIRLAFCGAFFNGDTHIFMGGGTSIVEASNNYKSKNAKQQRSCGPTRLGLDSSRLFR
jgi:hypothetical protein